MLAGSGPLLGGGAALGFPAQLLLLPGLALLAGSIPVSLPVAQIVLRDLPQITRGHPQVPHDHGDEHDDQQDIRRRMPAQGQQGAADDAAQQATAQHTLTVGV